MDSSKGPRFVLLTKGARKRTLEPRRDLKGKKITRVSVTVHYKDTQSQSQEEVLDEIDTSYRKPDRVDTDVYKVITTEDRNNEWASPSRMIIRPGEEKESAKRIIPGPWQLALRRSFLPSINKPITGSLEKEDWPRLIQWIRDGGPNGRVINPAESVIVKTGPKKGQMKMKPQLLVKMYSPTGVNETPCYYYFENRDRYNPICDEADCLSASGVTYYGKKCIPHLGAKAYAAVEISHEFNECTSFYSLCFKFDFENGATEARKNQRFKSTLQTNINSTGSQWLIYVARLKTQGIPMVHYVTKKEFFDRPDDAEKCLAKWETARLFATLNGSLYKGMLFQNLNASFALTYKNEGDMEAHLRTEFKAILTCSPVTPGNYVLPPELGRMVVANTEPDEDELTIYMQGNHEVMYSGKQNKTGPGIASDKSGHGVILRYLNAGGAPLLPYALLYCKKEGYEETEEVINLCNYIGHLFKLKNKFTEEDYLCLNKEVRFEFLIEKWGTIQEFCRHFFGMEIALTTI